MDVVENKPSSSPVCKLIRTALNATAKIPGEGQVRTWPKELAMDEKTKELILRRWKEYGF